MKKKSRWIVLTLAFMLALAGCGAEEKEENDTTTETVARI